jgi:hypothetical protein
LSIQDLGSIGELVGAIATVAMLAYLAVQIRQNTAQLRESARGVRLASLEHSLRPFSQYREFLTHEGNAEVYARGLESYVELSAAEKLRFRAIIEEYFFAYSTMFERMSQGLFENPAWHAQATTAASVLKTQGGREWWNARKRIFQEDFAAQIERLAE